MLEINLVLFFFLYTMKCLNFEEFVKYSQKYYEINQFFNRILVKYRDNFTFRSFLFNDLLFKD